MNDLSQTVKKEHTKPLKTPPPGTHIDRDKHPTTVRTGRVITKSHNRPDGLQATPQGEEHQPTTNNPRVGTGLRLSDYFDRKGGGGSGG